MIDLIHHVGIVVHSADRALEFFRDTMKLEVTADKVIEEQGVRGVLLAVGENEIELLEPTRADTGGARYLESKGEILHQICFRTDDIRPELARVQGSAVDLIDEVIINFENESKIEAVKQKVHKLMRDYPIFAY